jgi:hypothetical protein
MQVIRKKITPDLREYIKQGTTTSNMSIPGRNTPSVLGEQLERAYLIDVGVLLDTYSDIKNKRLRDGEIAAVVSSLVSSSLMGFALGAAGDNTAKNIISSIMNNLVSSKLGVWFYDFRINPQQVTISDRKLQTHTEYGWGYYDLEYFGNSFTTLSIRGTSGILLPEKPILNQGWTNIQLSVAYAKFELLRKLYMIGEARMMFVLFGKGYFGFLENFEYALNCENPRRIDYSLTFRAHPQLVFDLYAMDFSGIKNVSYILDPGSTQLTSLSNTTLFNLYNGR